MYITQKGKCFHVYEGIRENGKVRQVYICSLGRTDNPQEALDNAVRKGDKKQVERIREILPKLGRTGRTGRTEKTPVERDHVENLDVIGRTKPGRTKAETGRTGRTDTSVNSDKGDGRSSKQGLSNLKNPIPHRELPWIEYEVSPEKCVRKYPREIIRGEIVTKKPSKAALEALRATE